MQGLRIQWQRLADRIDALSLRERLMIFVAIIAVILFVTLEVILAPLNASRERLAQQIANRQQEIAAINIQLEQLAREYQKDPDARQRQRAAELEGTIARLDARLGKRTRGLVPPTEMARLVEQVLSRNQALELIALESLESEPLDAQSKQDAADPTRAPVVGLYKHGMRVEVRGRYRDLVRYLRALEALPWKVFWGNVTLTAESYPDSRLSVVLYTLSRRPGWIGM